MYYTITATHEAWIAAGTWATVVVLGVTLWFIYQQVREATTLRRQQSRPYVVPAIDVEQGHMALLTLENVGATAATDIRLRFDPEPQSTMVNFADGNFVTGTKPTLPPPAASIARILRAPEAPRAPIPHSWELIAL